MDAELIELSDLTNIVPPQQQSSSSSSSSSSEKPNFGGGLELLMNTTDLSNAGRNRSNSGGNDIDELKNIESELNNLIIDDAPPLKMFSPSEINLDSVKNPNLAAPEDITNTTWDGFSKISISDVNPDKVVQPATHVMTKEELMREKFKYLRKLETLESKGVTLTKKYNMDTPLCEMQGEYEMVLEEKTKQNSIKFQSNMLMALVNGIEFLNGKFDPFDIKLDGWSDQVNENISDYDDVFGELYEKYKHRASLAPELKLMFQLAGSGLMIHMTNTMFKSSMPGMDDILRQNPDLMKQFQNAAVKSMSATNPGFSGFVNNLSQEPTMSAGVRPGNNNSSTGTSNTMGKSVFSSPFQQNQVPASQPFKRAEMKGPTDIDDILSGLKTRTINVENLSNPNSNISLFDSADIDNRNVIKKSKRRPKSEKNTVSLDI